MSSAGARKPESSGNKGRVSEWSAGIDGDMDGFGCWYLGLGKSQKINYLGDREVIRQFYSRQFISFLLAGGLAALVNIGSRIVYSHWMNFSLAIVFAYVTGLITGFVLTKVFVFKGATQALHRSILFFVLVNVVAAAQTWLISMGLAFYVLPAMSVPEGYVENISHVIGVIFPVFTSYIGHKRWSFR